MILRIAVFALMALGLGGFGGIAWLATRSEPPAAIAAVVPISAIPAVTPQTLHVLAASRLLRAGTLMKPDDVTAGEASGVAADALADTPAMRQGLAGAMVRRSLAVGDVLTPADIVRPGDHGFLAAVLASGMRGVTVGVDMVSGSAGLIWPGDRVDLILTQELDNPSLPAGHRVFGETVLPNLRVVAIDQQMEQGANPTLVTNAPAKTVTLEVTPKQVETVVVASRIGRLSVVVRAADEAGTPGIADGPRPDPTIKPVSKNTPTWASDVSPALGAGPAQAGTTVRLFLGTAEGKEIKF